MNVLDSKFGVGFIAECDNSTLRVLEWLLFELFLEGVDRFWLNCFHDV